MKKYEGISLDLKDRSNWIAIIGSRKPTFKEKERAFSFAQECAANGKIVVSGLALGIDTVAHEGAIEGGGLTVAVVNTPSTQLVYPKENRALAERIKKNGGILFPFQTKAIESNEKGLNQFSKRLIERDILVAHLCSTIIAVTDKNVIDGGTRWAVATAKELGKEVKRLDSRGFFHENPDTGKAKIFWEMEMKIRNK